MTVWPNGSKSIPRVTSEYGPRTPIDTNGDGRPDTSAFHSGIDLVGFPINKAPFAGRVIFARYNGGAGNEVRVQKSNGDVARIKHNARFLVTEGQSVAEGQDVGVMGTTGASTGIHCHFETWPGGTAHTNPRVYMASAIAAGGDTTPIGGDEDEDDMKNSGFYYTRGSDKVVVYLIVNTISGWYHEYSGVGGTYNNPVAAAFGTGSYASITEAHAKVIKAACDRVLAAQAVTVNAAGGGLNDDERALLAKAAATPTAAAIADAVNDDAAKRLQG